MKDPNARINRIITRAISYNNGYLTAESFSLIEAMDAEQDDIADIHKISFNQEKRILEAISNIINGDDDDATKEPQPEAPALSMTLEEYNSLPLYKQSEIYGRYPDEVEKLLHPVVTVQVTKDFYNKMPLSEQSAIFQEKPDQVKALLDGSIPYFETEVCK